jgi:hypothetical protein
MVGGRGAAIGSDARIKGAAIREFVRWYSDTDPYAFARAVDRMPPALRQQLDQSQDLLGIVSSVWYPAPTIFSLLDGILEDVPPNERRRLARAGARAVLNVTLKGIYASVFRLMMTPERYALQSQRLWDRFYDTGTMKKIALGPCHHRTIISDWGAHHPFICELHAWSSEHIYAAMGCRFVTVERTQCISEGASDCRFEVHWR